MIFSFDDADKSIMEVALPIMDKYRVPGVLYTCARLIDANERSLRQNDLLTLRDAGWEIGSHTFTHARITTCSRWLLDNELALNVEFLSDLGIETAGFAYPWGVYNDTVIEAVKKYHKYARATSGTMSSEHSDRWRLKAMPLGGWVTLEDAKNNDSQFFFCHKLGKTRNVSTWDEKDFEKLVEYFQNSITTGEAIYETF